MPRGLASISLPYGIGEQSASVPDGWTLDLVASMGPEVLPDPEEALRAALEEPQGSLPLSERLPRGGRLLAMISDRTRRDGKRAVLGWLLGFLEEEGIAADQVDLLICPGAHRMMSPTEIEAMLGKNILGRCRVLQHDCDAPTRPLGTTSRGTPIAFNPVLWDYDLLLPYSAITHHYFAGFGGGRKMFVPGVASREAIRRSHGLCFRSAEEGGGRRPGVEAAILKGNPVHEDFIEATRALERPIFALQSIVGPLESGFLGFFTGDWQLSHEKGCQAYLGWKTFPVKSGYDLVLSSSGGAPLDNNLIQAHKGIDNAARLLKPGGWLVHLAACSDGLGGDEVPQFLKIPRREIETRLQQHYSIHGQTVSSLKEKAERLAITLVSGLPCEVADHLGMTSAPDLDTALDRLLPELSSQARIALFPEAGALLPRGQRS